ncbi:MAG TPA: multicopper oxidase domain-containing protein [Micromonosporaceae bacterium]|nr:multicopper oxidase domain-containing protein [Micromonosporaceae bacterium]
MSVSNDPSPSSPVAGSPNTLRSFLKILNPLLPVIGTAVALGLLIGFVAVGVFKPRSAVPAAAAAVPDVKFDIELGDLYVKPSSIDIPFGARVVLNVTNKGAMDHTLVLEGKDEPMLKPGESKTFVWDGITKSTEAWCPVSGHKEAGMVLAVNVVGDTSTAAGSLATAADSSAKIDANAQPAADWTAYDPTVAPADGNKIHEVELRVKETEIEVAPGVRQTLWTYNGTAPGPVLRGTVGDIFRVKLINDGTMNHSIDFHASKVSPDVEMRDLRPGESLIYQFKADFSGVFTYHCGTGPMIHHMGNGMFGAVIVDPPNLPKVDREIALIHSELYLGPNGEVGDLKKMLANESDGSVFNGYYNQYVFQPIEVKRGERVRIWIANAAINDELSFHIVGTIFDTVWKEGSYLLKPGGPDRGGSQTLDLSVTQGGFVEFTLDAPGNYPFVNHEMRNLSRGALGLLSVK